MGGGASSHHTDVHDEAAVSQAVYDMYSKDPEQAKLLVEAANKALANAKTAPPANLKGAQKARMETHHLVEGMVHQEFERDVRDVYSWKGNETLGEGLSGTVVRVVHKDTGIHYAMKTLRLDKADPKSSLLELKKEISIMAELDHPNIVRIMEVFYTESAVFLILELCEGGELFDHLLNHNSFTESEASEIVRKIVSATRYLHE